MSSAQGDAERHEEDEERTSLSEEEMRVAASTLYDRIVRIEAMLAVLLAHLGIEVFVP